MLTGTAHVYGDNIDTDRIIPGKYTKTLDTASLAEHVLEDLDPDFRKNMRPGDMVVAGDNFGCGSSREQAPVALKAAGVSVVIARYFARIFFRNAINIGLPALEVPDHDIRPGDRIEVRLDIGEVRNLSTGKTYRATRMPETMMQIMAEGGLSAYLRKYGGLQVVYLLLIFNLLCKNNLSAQLPRTRVEEPPRNQGKAVLINFNAGAFAPGGDLAKRFSNGGALGLGGEYITAGNLAFGVEGYYYFGFGVKEDPLTNLRTPEGGIIGNDRVYASVALRQRGWYGGATLGKLFPFGDKRAGLRLTFGAGLTRHWIRVQDDGNTVTQLTGDYLKGYDRLSGGFALHQFVGWQKLGKQRRSNWTLGLQFQQGFTNTLRDWDFAEKRKLDGSRIDLRFGIRATWTLPFYPVKAESIYY
jgi:3-isopropylmalate dehydratase small subunit